MMKRQNRFPPDLVALLFAPVVVLTVIGLVAGCAMSLFNWLAAHH